MKKIIYIVTAVLIMISCKHKSRDYVTLSGKIINKDSDTIRVFSMNGNLKNFVLAEDGTFSGTFKADPQKPLYYSLILGKLNQISILLKNGYDLNLTVDAQQPQKTINYTGIGSEINNYANKSSELMFQSLNDLSIHTLDKNAFSIKLEKIIKKLSKMLQMCKSTYPEFFDEKSIELEDFKKRMEQKREITNTLLALKNGVEAPKFVDYENYAGGTSSLDDFKGKYVYIDIWATTCPPCLAQLPHLKELKKKYSYNKNIEFVCISFDREKEYEFWRKKVEESNVGGVQLIAKEDEITSFKNSYGIYKLPRFILIDTEGKIISPDAPKPSDPKLIELFEEVGIK